MPVGEVVLGQGLLPFGHLPLLLQFQVAEDRHEDDEDDETHARADDEA